MQTQLERISEAEWKGQFLDACNTERNLLEEIWDATWQENCDGKKLFVDLQKRLEINMPLLRFKKAVIREMKNASTETWRSMESLLRELLKSPTQTSGEQIGAPQLIPVP